MLRFVGVEVGRLIATNVLRLKNVAKMQHQAFTNITKTLNLKNMFQDTS